MEKHWSVSGREVFTLKLQRVRLGSCEEHDLAEPETPVKNRLQEPRQEMVRAWIVLWQCRCRGER